MATTTSGATVYHSYKFPAFTTSTNIGPLTKSLAFNTGCYTNMIDMNRNGLGPSGAWKTLGCAMSSCCPSGNIYTEEWAWMTSYYSPGVCPSDYQSCAPPTQSGLSLTPKTGEKIVFCCPNNCICPNDEDMPENAPGACGSRLTKSSETTVYTVMNNFKDQRPETTVPYDFEPGLTEELQIAWPIQIRLPATRFSGYVGDPTSTPSSSNNGAQTSRHGGLSTGAIVGIAFGGFFSIFLTCLITFLVLRKRRSRKEQALQAQQAQQAEQADHLAAEEMANMPPEMAFGSPAPPYSPSSPWMQRKPVGQQWANVDQPRYEMSATSPNTVVELPARW